MPPELSMEVKRLLFKRNERLLGSVTDANAEELIKQPNIDGFLVIRRVL